MIVSEYFIMIKVGILGTIKKLVGSERKVSTSPKAEPLTEKKNEADIKDISPEINQIEVMSSI
jgi:hypothetical protein